MAPNGDVYFSDVRESKIFRVDAKTSEVSLFKDNTGWTNGLMFGPDGRLYTCRRKTEQIVAIDVETMEEEVIAEGAQPNDIVINAKGDLYFSSPWTKRVWFVPKGGEARIVFEDPNSGFLNGLMLSPDQSMLMVNDSRKKFVWSFQIEPDGSLAYGEEFFRLETWDKNSQSRADGMTIADDGHLFVATDLGVQVCNDKGPVDYSEADEGVRFKRRLRRTGAQDSLRDRVDEAFPPEASSERGAALGAVPAASAWAVEQWPIESSSQRCCSPRLSFR